ncbi:MAG: lysophospholipid acyltransferase family protein [Thiotrichaceae bacterium]
MLLLLGVVGWHTGQQAHRAEWGHSWLNAVDGLNRLFCQHYHRLQAQPLTLPDTGAAIVVANHLSGLDPMLLLAISPRPLRFLILREEYERFWLKWFFKRIGCIPVDRETRPELALRAALHALQQGEVIAIFPQATFVRPGESRRLKKGSFWLANQINCAVYPVHIAGIRRVATIFPAILTRNHAILTSYPATLCPEQSCIETVQALLEKVVTAHQ